MGKPRHPWVLPILGIVVAIGGLVVGIGLWRYRASGQNRRPDRRGAGVAEQADYVDSRVCGTCHAAIFESYQKTGMAGSFYRPEADSTEALGPNNRFYHAGSGTYFSMLRHHGRLYQRRWQTGYKGVETNVEETPVDFVMGSGHHVRTYLHRTRRGTLIELPLAWYAENGGYWAMNPGYDTDHPPSRREIGYDCMFCHNAYPGIPADHVADYGKAGDEPVFPEDMPLGIDCQRCHGPGSTHVRLAKAGKADKDSLRKAIVNPARLSPDRQMEVCMQCHLETTSFRLPNAIRRFDRGPFSYRPNEPLGNFMIFFDDAAGSGREDKFEIVNSAYRLRQSRCFRESKGALTCLTCHDPHAIPRGAQALQYYSEVCRRCHAATLEPQIAIGKHTRAADCTTCHMPKRRTQDVVHAVMTDHLIERQAPPNLLTAIAERHETGASAYHGEVVPYYPAPLAPTPENALYVDVAQVSEDTNLEAGIARLSRDLEQQKPARPEFYLALGDAFRDAGRPNDAVAAYERAVNLRPASSLFLQRLGVALKDSGQYARATDVLTRAVRAGPNDARARYELGLLESEQNQGADALAQFEKAVALDPDFPEAFNNLGSVQAEGGQLEPAERAFRAAIRIRPAYAEAHANLAKLLSSRGDLDQAVFHFRKAVALQPEFPAAHYDYGVTLANMGQIAAAKHELAIAARGPDSDIRQKAAQALGQLP